MVSLNDSNDRNNDASQWVAFKRDKAHRFVELGYSVQWHPDTKPFMLIYVPGWVDRLVEYRAQVLCTLRPSVENLDSGHILGMRLTEARFSSLDDKGIGGLEQRTLYSYINGESTFLYSPRHRRSAHELNPVTMALYHDVRMAFGPSGIDDWEGYRL